VKVVGCHTRALILLRLPGAPNSGSTGRVPPQYCVGCGWYTLSAVGCNAGEIFFTTGVLSPRFNGRPTTLWGQNAGVHKNPPRGGKNFSPGRKRWGLSMFSTKRQGFKGGSSKRVPKVEEQNSFGSRFGWRIRPREKIFSEGAKKPSRRIVLGPYHVKKKPGFLRVANPGIPKRTSGHPGLATLEWVTLLQGNTRSAWLRPTWNKLGILPLFQPQNAKWVIPNFFTFPIYFQFPYLVSVPPFLGARFGSKNGLECGQFLKPPKVLEVNFAFAQTEWG